MPWVLAREFSKPAVIFTSRTADMGMFATVGQRLPKC
jgi:hypothetical protein